MKKIAESLGMADPDIDYDQYSVGDKDVATSVKTEPLAMEPVKIDAEYEEKRIREADEELDALIREGKAAARETLETAGDLEPRSQSRAREVGAQLLKVTLDAVKQKQEAAFAGRDFKLKEISAGHPSQISKTQINNITVSDRESIFKALTESGESDEDTA